MVVGIHFTLGTDIVVGIHFTLGTNMVVQEIHYVYISFWRFHIYSVVVLHCAVCPPLSVRYQAITTTRTVTCTHSPRGNGWLLWTYLSVSSTKHLSFTQLHRAMFVAINAFIFLSKSTCCTDSPRGNFFGYKLIHVSSQKHLLYTQPPRWCLLHQLICFCPPKSPVCCTNLLVCFCPPKSACCTRNPRGQWQCSAASASCDHCSTGRPAPLALPAPRPSWRPCWNQMWSAKHWLSWQPAHKEAQQVLPLFPPLPTPTPHARHNQTCCVSMDRMLHLKIIPDNNNSKILHLY